MSSEKVRENKLRRIAERRGLRLEKSRRRDPQAIGFGGYMLVDSATNAAVAGMSPIQYAFDLEAVEAWLSLAK